MLTKAKAIQRAHKVLREFGWSELNEKRVRKLGWYEIKGAYQEGDSWYVIVDHYPHESPPGHFRQDLRFIMWS